MPRSSFARHKALALAAATLILCASAHTADATAGKQYLRQQCLPCHGAEPVDNGGDREIPGRADRENRNLNSWI
jgi:mono/diheme cytochrome c family protein